MASVLIADDDQLMMDVLGAFLSDCGHEVACALSGKEALNLGQHRPPDVLICDYSLAELDGPSLARRLQNEAPDLRVFVASGHAAPMVRAASQGIRNLRVLTKPLDLDELEASLRD